MTTFIAFLYVTMAILCITGITLTVSEIQTIWLKYKRYKADQKILCKHAIDPLPILREIKERTK